METKKSLIRQNAEIEIAGMDLGSKLHAYPLDVDAANKLVDQKYELQKAADKIVIDALAKLKAQLSKDQYETMHSLWEQHEDKDKHER